MQECWHAMRFACLALWLRVAMNDNPISPGPGVPGTLCEPVPEVLGAAVLLDQAVDAHLAGQAGWYRRTSILSEIMRIRAAA